MTEEFHLRALFDAEAFEDEQARLGRLWTFMGCASDLPGPDHWFRTRLGGRSVFLQRFAEGVRGFVNRCAHRAYPLRTADQGQGPVVCGFHHWRYNAQGEAAGIPNCQDGFGTNPRGVGRRLAPLDVDQCGDLIFARIPGEQASLRSFLGPAFDVLALLCADTGGAARARLSTRANWRLVQWISMDEYHLAAVHPDSFGKKGRYIARKSLNYARLGPHSSYFLGEHSGSMEDWATLLREGRRDPIGYRIIHLFPDTAVFLPPGVAFGGEHFRYAIILRQRAMAFDRTETQVWTFRTRAAAEARGLISRALEPLEPLRLRLARHLCLKVLREDRVVCERLQEEARQITPDPLYGAAERRVAWFNDAYSQAMQGPRAPD
jgi:phenylpropionate dioxygenase-like ring-hydroxylating dioxygenase large terminal subunit